MDKLFIDSDVLLDVFAKRQPYYLYSSRLLTLIEKKKISAYTSALVFANLHYILQKSKSKNYALQTLRKIRILVSILPITEKTIDLALNSDFPDFEDAIQYYASKDGKVDSIITRNKSDYKNSKIPVHTPEEYLAMLQSTNN